MKIALGCDHGGFEMKMALLETLKKAGMTIEDLGCFDRASVDYPDYAAAVAEKVSQGLVSQGLLICTTGIGMSIVANKYPRIRAALCLTPRMARMSRAHNNANVLVLGGELTTIEEAREVVSAWLEGDFDQSERHQRRVNKIHSYACSMVDPVETADEDPEIYVALQNEKQRQTENLELIASENYVSRSIREAAGSLLTNKYAEGYPGKRWYDGCVYVDDVERLAIDRAKQLFGAEHVNVQPHSGSSANMAVYFSILNPGDRVLAMDPSHGGHLTHGMKVNFSGRYYNVLHYGVSRETEQIDYAEVARLAEAHKPKLIIAGASAYPRILDFKRFRQIADSVSAYLMVDMAHIAGLVAAGYHPNPVPYSHFVTSTTHKTLRGPRAGIIFCQEQFAKDIDKQVFPGMQGGPLMHIIAAKAICFRQAGQPGFKTYQEQVVRNAQALADGLKDEGLRMVSDGTDNHLILVDLTSARVTGKDMATALDEAGITVNKNMIPFDTKPPAVSSGIRLGTPAVTTRGMKEREMRAIAGWIGGIARDPKNTKLRRTIRVEVQSMTAKFPLP